MCVDNIRDGTAKLFVKNWMFRMLKLKQGDYFEWLENEITACFGLIEIFRNLSHADHYAHVFYWSLCLKPWVSQRWERLFVARNVRTFSNEAWFFCACYRSNIIRVFTFRYDTCSCLGGTSKDSLSQWLQVWIITKQFLPIFLNLRSIGFRNEPKLVYKEIWHIGLDTFWKCSEKVG